MSTSPFPSGYVQFDDVRTSIPEPRRIQVSESVELETIHVDGSGPAIVFVHGGLGSLWNPYPQLDAFEGEQELVTYSLAGNGNSTTRPTQSLTGHVAMIERPAAYNRLLRALLVAIEDDRDLETTVRDRLGEYTSD